MDVYIEWRDIWLLDIEDVDQEHKELVDLVNELARRHHCARRDNGDGRSDGSEILELLQQIGESVREHFRNEEACMLNAGYPGYEQHRYEHITLLAEYAEFMREVHGEGPECIDETTLDALKGWLISHIAGADRRFGDYYRSTVTGVEQPRSDPFTRKWMRLASET